MRRSTILALSVAILGLIGTVNGAAAPQFLVPGLSKTSGMLPQDVTTADFNDAGKGDVAVANLGPAAKFNILHSFSGVPDGNQPASLLKTRDGTLWGVTVLGGSAEGVGHGVLYKIGRDGNFTLSHTFTDTPDGSMPGRLIQGSDGSIYGLTAFGGANSSGTVYRVDLSGNYSIVHSFNGTTEGSYPDFLIQASDGFFYGTTSTNGTAPSNCVLHQPQGTLFRMDVSGSVTPLHTFCESIDGSTPNSVVEAQDGFLYGTCIEDGPLGGDLGLGTMWKSTKAGEITLLHVFGPTMANGAQPNEPLGIVQAADGFFYGAAHGGLEGEGAIFRADTAGNVVTIHSFNVYGSDGIDPDSDLLLGQDGFFYGTTAQGGLPIDNFNRAGVVYRADTAGHVWVLHTFVGADGATPAARPFLAGRTLYATAITRGPLDHGVTISIPLKPNLPIVGLAFNPNPVKGGQSTTATLTLAKPAGPSGQIVSLFGSGPLRVPKTVTIPAGQRVVTFTVGTQPVGGTFAFDVTAYIEDLGMSSPLTITP